MTSAPAFESEIRKSYTFESASVTLGAAISGGKPFQGLQVNLPLSTLNRHGLIAGATGTGKTKSLQRLAESLSERSVPVLLMDMKGDVSGISRPGTDSPKIQERVKAIGGEWKAAGYPAEFLSISAEKGTRLRATVSEFGPVFFSKMLELNETQSSILSLIFKYADDQGLPLVDLKDIRKLIQYLTNEGKSELKQDYGSISTASTGLILRKIVEIEEQGAGAFFGERSFDVEDLLRVDANGFGMISVLRLTDIQTKPRLFSTFMLCLLAEIFQKFPEEGDVEQPKLVIFIDEAHLIFKEATKTLLSELETVIKLVRSKGVGIIFCTQSPSDIPPGILAQLGLKIQHALRAFTAVDRKAIKLAAENYPLTSHYKVEDLITQLGIGEALVTGLNERGEPTALVHTLMAPPRSRMDTITPAELDQTAASSTIALKYSQTLDSESAYELLSAKLGQASASAQEAPAKKAPQAAPARSPRTTSAQSAAGKYMQSLGKSVATSIVRNLTGQITRTLLGSVLGPPRRRRY